MLRLMSLSLLLLYLIHLISAQTILQDISSDTTYNTLTVSNSPYIVNSYVTFHPTTHVIIENGVQIIFTGDHFISVYGSLNCGCNNTDILNNKTKGLSNNNTYIHMIGNESAPMSIGIFINHEYRIGYPPKIVFCNTLFENIQNGIVTTATQYKPYTVYNCEFRHVNNAIKHSTNIINFVYNSYFHEMNSVQSGGGVIYDNCLFRFISGKFSSNMQQAFNISIRNSEIYGNENQVCININSIANDPYYGIYNNIINGCKDGIEIWNTVAIRNNTIHNCTRYGIYIKNIDLSLKYDVDVMYNTFYNNGEYDIYMDDVASLNVEYNNINAIYAHNCDKLSLYMNQFMDRTNKKQNHIITAKNCTEINVLENSFINNEYKLGVLLNGNKYINISNNIFMGNTMQYLIKMEDIMNCTIHNNDIINNTIYEYMIDSKCNEVSLQYNIIQDNMQTSSTKRNELITQTYRTYGKEFIRIQTANPVIIAYNLFINNKNNILDIQSNLLYLYQPQELNILHNEFDTNYMNHILYINYSDYNHTIATIQYNDFIEKQNHINNYIQIYTKSVNTYGQLLYINMNNFYNKSNVNHFIATNNININANSNYYDGLKSYPQISSKLNDICDSSTIGFINITRVSEHPMNINDIMDMLLIYHCSWNLINCTTIENRYCDSDTYTPTISPSNIPTERPTTFIIVAGTPTDSIQPTQYATIPITTSENDNISSTVKIKAEIHIKTSQMNHSILIIAASIGIAFLCLVSIEVIYCLRRNNTEQQIAKRHLSYSDNIKQHSDDHRTHSQAIPPPPPPSECQISISIENESKEEAQILVNNDGEIEGNMPPIVPVKKCHVKDHTMTMSNGFGENDINEQELYGIQLAEDEFIVGSLPKKTDDGFGEGEYFVVRNSLCENDDVDSPTAGV